MAELLINGIDASTYGVRMGDGFIDALENDIVMKENVENKSRLNHGKTLIVSPKIEERNVTLTFNIEGSSESDFKTKRANFKTLLKTGEISIKVPDNSDDIYHLEVRQSTSYAGNVSRTFCKMAVKFCEPNPANRV